jgi:hypothetical protein
MGITRRNDLVEKGVARLLGQFSNSPKLQALAATYLRQAQKVETAAWDVIDAINIDTGPAFMLAIFGRLVGRGQSTFTLDQFRALIRATVRALRSNGVHEDFLAVARLAVNDLPAGVSFYLQNAGTKAIQITSFGPEPDVGYQAIWELFLGVKNATTRLYFIFQPGGDSTAYLHADAGGAFQPDLVHGDSSATTSGFGGLQAGVYSS